MLSTTAPWPHLPEWSRNNPRYKWCAQYRKSRTNTRSPAYQTTGSSQQIGKQSQHPLSDAYPASQTSRSPVHTTHNEQTPAHTAQLIVWKQTLYTHAHPATPTSPGRTSQPPVVYHHAAQQTNTRQVLTPPHQPTQHHHQYRRHPDQKHPARRVS